MAYLTPVEGTDSVPHLAPAQAQTQASSPPAPLPTDKIELSPEATAALEAARAEQGQTAGLEAQEEIALQVLKEVMGAPRRILAGLGLISSS